MHLKATVILIWVLLILLKIGAQDMLQTTGRTNPIVPPSSLNLSEFDLNSSDAIKRRKIVSSLFYAPPNEDLMPVFIRGCSDPDVEVRDFAVRCLSRLGKAAQTAVPAISNLCSDCLLLGGLGPSAKSAVPALRLLAANHQGTIAESFANSALTNIVKRQDLVATVKQEAQKFVSLYADIEIDNHWSYWLQEDYVGPQIPAYPHSIFRKPYSFHCVVGTNIWMLEGDFNANTMEIHYFTGSNILEFVASPTEFPLVSYERSRVQETIDGNPGRPIRVLDLMEAPGNICWLAFCSGPALKRVGRQLYPPNTFWKEYLPARTFVDKTRTFEDDFGLPRTIELLTPKNQLAFSYEVFRSTNILGWNFPLEFAGVQYRGAWATNWVVDTTFKGRVTSIDVGSEPQIPLIHKVTSER